MGKRIAGWSLLLLLLLVAPLQAQNVTPIRPLAAPANVNTIQVDYRQKYESEREKNQQLRAENSNLQSQLAAWTSKGGSQVHAYCETPTLSANSAGARNDCAAAGRAHLRAGQRPVPDQRRQWRAVRRQLHLVRIRQPLRAFRGGVPAVG